MEVVGKAGILRCALNDKMMCKGVKAPYPPGGTFPLEGKGG